MQEENKVTGRFEYLGSKIQQHLNVFNIFNDFFNKNYDFKQVIEIGTGFGGFSMFLKDRCDEICAQFITFEKFPHNKNHNELLCNPEFKKRNIDLKICDVFEDENIGIIKNLINQQGRTLILCDGGNKVKEFNLFSNFLKYGDIIMAHDYIKDFDTFESKFKNKIWNWQEIKDLDIENTCKINNLLPYFNKFEEVVWCCRIKSY